VTTSRGVDTLVEQALAGDQRAIARLITLVEDNGAEARAVVAALYPRTGRAHIIGVTGAPGTGKSTLVNALAKAYRRADRTVSIVAIDPTSPFTGGAILGDRIRMQELAGDRGVFIRSMASRGSLGGLAWATGDAVKILDAVGYGMVLIETVGAGQAEVEIASTAHTTLVVTAPGLGDEVQAMKAGILEIADVLIVNKADREGADSTAAALEAMLDLDSRRGSWRPPVLRTIATQEVGIDAVIEQAEKHFRHIQASGQLRAHEQQRAKDELSNVLRQGLMRELLARIGQDGYDALVDQVATRQLDPYAAAERLLRDPPFKTAGYPK
jgi:LAO/AO transport system kinase